MEIRADRILYNGRFYSMAAEGDTFTALAIKGGEIAAIGTDEEIRSIPSDAETDLGGKTVLPGFINTHCHLGDFAEDYCKVNLEGARSIADVIALLKARIPELDEGAWVVGYQLDMLKLIEQRLPDRCELDQVSEEIPVFLSHICKHNFVGNSKVLELAGIGPQLYGTEDAKYAEFDADGVPTGRLKEHGLITRVNAQMPPILEENAYGEKILKKALDDYASKGFTTIHSFGGLNENGIENPRMYQRLEERGDLPVRVIFNYMPGKNRPDILTTGFGCQKMQYGAVKIFADGSLYQWSAYVRDEYADQPGGHGMLALGREGLYRQMKKYYEEGNDLAIHCIGDAAIDVVLDIIEDIYDPGRNQIFRLIHCTLSNPDQYERISRYPIIIDAQPIFIPLIDGLAKIRLGEKRLENVLRFKSWLNHGIRITGGDDSPICDNNPFVGIRHAVTRETSFGGNIAFPQESLSVYEAVQMYTKSAAYSSREEDVKGTLEVGKLADMIVLDRDIFRIAPENISETKVLSSYMGGVERRWA